MCKLCEKNPVYEFTNKRKLCKTCFVHWFQKKFFYTIRKFGLIKSEDKISLENKRDFNGVVLASLFKTFSGKLMINLVKSGNKKAVAETIDSESNEIIHTIIQGKASDLRMVSPIEKKGKNVVIKPLYLFLDKEVLFYAKLMNLKFKEKKTKQDKISKVIEDFEEKHPEVKRAIVNSYLKIC